ncbi:MAG: carboxypeptidase-like regulatory domain-containing protein [Rhodothermales bacterium]
MRTPIQLLSLLVLCLVGSPVFAQSGKISGQVTDAATGDPLPGVNVVIDGTTQGTSTGSDGYYSIINVRPGTYDVRASFIGFTPQVVEDVRVSIDLTAEVNFDLTEQAVGLDEVVVSAEREVVKTDLSASRVDVTSAQIENLPVNDINRVVGLQAGVQGMNIRGAGADQAAVFMDGLNLTSRRDNTPYTGISYSSIEEIQIQSGGFTAKYGNMRSGIVNVVTKEGQRDSYEATINASYSPPAKKYFGIDPNDPNSYWMRPYTDSEVAFEGTDEWDDFTQNQYPRFDGYSDMAESLANNDNPDDDLTPEQLQDIFEFRHRRDIEPDAPDYTVDGGVGGPVPGISDALGDLRFYATYRRANDQYIIPRSRDGFSEENSSLKLTSNIAQNMKLVLHGMMGQQAGTSTEDRGGTTRIVRDGNVQTGTGSTARYGLAEDQIFSNGTTSISTIKTNLIGASFTHTPNPSTFYEVRLQRLGERYSTVPPEERDESPVECFGNFCLDEAPLGWKFQGATSFENMRMGGHWAEFRDTSSVAQYSARFDITSQVNRTNLVESGVELIVGPQDINFGFIDALINPNDVYGRWNETEIYAAAYLQDKLEFQGMIANVGLRLDYMDPSTDWYVYDDPYSDAFLGKNVDQFEELIDQERVSPQIALSPRVGVSFPVTVASKLYLNYGHAYQRPKPQDLYRLTRRFQDDGVFQIANPNNPMMLTIQYELGYEQSFLDQFLVRIAGYYRDSKNQPRQVAFISRDGLIDYDTNVPDSYSDTRGVEISLFKSGGEWIRGFVNYTYMVDSGGNFGFPSYRENRIDQIRYERGTTDYYQNKPLARPFARANIEVITPDDFGPDLGGLALLGDLRLSLLGEWKHGEYFTYTGREPVSGIQSNMHWRHFRNVDARISKNFEVGDGMAVNAYVDIFNVFSLKNFNASSFGAGEDFNQYMNSLRLPEEMVEGWEQFYVPSEDGEPLYGDDIPGTLGKDYVDPPNISSFHYLFPRRVFFGMRLSL